MQADNLHVIIHTDIGMNPVTTLVAGLRLAPLQCKGWGHPVTTGLPSIDYYLSSDLMEPPGADEHYSETLVRLPNLALAWHPPDLKDLAPDRRRFGIRQDSFVFLSTQSLFKYLPQHDDIYPRIASQVADCLFVFIEAPAEAATERFKRRLETCFRRFGLEMERFCLFVPRLGHADFLRLNLSADVLLDSLEWSGGKTTLEALACGLPVVTLPGRFMRGRHAYAMLSLIGVDETIALSKRQYCRIASRLANDKEFFDLVIQKIQSNRKKLENDVSFLHRLETFIVSAVESALTDTAPENSRKVSNAHPTPKPEKFDPEKTVARAMALQARGQNSRAASIYRHYLTMVPDDSTAWFNLAVALYKIERFGESVSAYRKALEIKPGWPEAWFNLAAALEAAGDHESAIDAYNSSIAARPDYHDAYYNLGLLLAEKGDVSKAVAALTKATALNPSNARAWHHLADAMARQEKYSDARKAYQQAINLSPKMWQAYNNLGNILLKQGDIDFCIKCYFKVVEACPDLAQAHYNLGSALRLAEQYGKAEASLKRALVLDPSYAEAWNNLALTYKNQGLYSKALDCLNKALDCNPELAMAHWNRAFIHLLRADFKQGWQDFQWRFKIDIWKSIYPFRLDLPAWKGEYLDGTLFVHDEQGLGDTIQFVRYLEHARKRCNRLVLETREELAPLLSDMPGVDQLLIRPKGSCIRRPDVKANAFVPLMNLPMIFKTDLESIPWQGPYIRIPSDRIKKWYQRLGDSSFRVAVIWAGRPQHTNDRNRSLTFGQLSKVLALDLDFIGLQKGPASRQVDKKSKNLRFVNIGRELEDFLDTAAVLTLCDLVITVDTAAAHLAGALGRPVWVLVPYVPDWRWMLDRTDTPWYPSMKLYRQQQPNDWRPVIERVRNDLQALI